MGRPSPCWDLRGPGKSVLLKHIVGLIRPDRGQVIVDGKEVRKLNRHDLRDLRETIGYVFQNGALFDSHVGLREHPAGNHRSGEVPG